MTYEVIDEVTFPAIGWVIDDWCTLRNPKDRIISANINIHKRVNNPEEAFKLEELMDAMNRYIGTSCFAFGVSGDPIFNKEREALIKERNEWKNKYEELKSQIEFTRNFMKDVNGGNSNEQ